MAALQQSAIAFQTNYPPATRSSSNVLPPKTVRLSFSGSFSSIRIPKLAAKLSGKSRNRGASGAKMTDTAAGRYATALADLAQSNGTLEATSADLEKIEKIFSEPGVYDFFVNPTIGEEKKIEIINEIENSASLQPHTVNFLNILVDMKRIELIKDMVKEFEVVYNKMTDTELAVVTSVVKLESQHLAQIAKGVQALTGAKNVRIKTMIDPSLVAGFTVRYGNAGSKLIDMSVRKQLEDIASQLDFSNISIPI
ncbi:hypothetical protein NE237_018920 [Protea cynaroides]|uniref:ATP synthase delta chain, chloroplastic n=1 Tax=Protea cynaroides TaxID=273540 RepID=A0A9Q0KB08_9MAGN|nr:hypothetical protein NE237_018920 [Protea cynaroides]